MGMVDLDYIAKFLAEATRKTTKRKLKIFSYEYARRLWDIDTNEQNCVMPPAVGISLRHVDEDTINLVFSKKVYTWAHGDIKEWHENEVYVGTVVAAKIIQFRGSNILKSAVSTILDKMGRGEYNYLLSEDVGGAINKNAVVIYKMPKVKRQNIKNMTDGTLKYDCTCQFYDYYLRYTNAKSSPSIGLFSNYDMNAGDFLPREKSRLDQFTTPHINNPHGIPYICKHIYAVIENLIEKGYLAFGDKNDLKSDIQDINRLEDLIKKKVRGKSKVDGRIVALSKKLNDLELNRVVPLEIDEREDINVRIINNYIEYLNKYIVQIAADIRKTSTDDKQDVKEMGQALKQLKDLNVETEKIYLALRKTKDEDKIKQLRRRIGEIYNIVQFVAQQKRVQKREEALDFVERELVDTLRGVVVGKNLSDVISQKTGIVNPLERINELEKYKPLLSREDAETLVKFLSSNGVLSKDKTTFSFNLVHNEKEFAKYGELLKKLKKIVLKDLKDTDAKELYMRWKYREELTDEQYETVLLYRGLNEIEKMRRLKLDKLDKSVVLKLKERTNSLRQYRSQLKRDIDKIIEVVQEQDEAAAEYLNFLIEELGAYRPKKFKELLGLGTRLSVKDELNLLKGLTGKLSGKGAKTEVDKVVDDLRQRTMLDYIKRQNENDIFSYDESLITKPDIKYFYMTIRAFPYLDLLKWMFSGYDRLGNKNRSLINILQKKLNLIDGFVSSQIKQLQTIVDTLNKSLDLSIKDRIYLRTPIKTNDYYSDLRGHPIFAPVNVSNVNPTLFKVFGVYPHSFISVFPAYYSDTLISAVIVYNVIKSVIDAIVNKKDVPSRNIWFTGGVYPNILFPLEDNKANTEEVSFSILSKNLSEEYKSLETLDELVDKIKRDWSVEEERPTSNGKEEPEEPEEQDLPKPWVGKPWDWNWGAYIKYDSQHPDIPILVEKAGEWLRDYGDLPYADEYISSLPGVVQNAFVEAGYS